MLLMTVQRCNIAAEMLTAPYEADFWKSEYSCVSPRYTRGYNSLVDELERKTGSRCSAPVFAWGGTPFIDSFAFSSGSREVLFLDVPESKIIFSDYDKFCDYVNGVSSSMNYMLSETQALNRISREYCVQASITGTDPSMVVSHMNLEYFEGVTGSVNDCLGYCRLLSSYFKALGMFENKSFGLLGLSA